jgi:hypothetical protein
MLHNLALLKCVRQSGLKALIAYFGLNFSGFCFAKMRYITTEEKIRWTFDDLNDASQLRVNISGRGFQDVDFVKYESFDKYIKENPECRTFYASGGSPELPPPTWLQRIFGYHSGTFVPVSYTHLTLPTNGW